MPASLPVELVEYILELAVPTNVTSTTYADRQALLRILSLVSSSVRAVTQPQLDAVVYITDEEPWKAYMRSVAHRTSTVELLWVTSGATTWKELAAFLPRCKALRELRLFDFDDVDLSCLSGLEHLQYLSLEEVTLTSVDFVLPHVMSLSYYVQCYQTYDEYPKITPSSFPSLRHLAICPATTDEYLVDGLLAQQLDHLHALDPVDPYAPLPGPLLPERLLVDLDPENLQQGYFLCRHPLRIMNGSTHWSVVNELVEVTETLRSTPPSDVSLPLVYFPSLYRSAIHEDFEEDIDIAVVELIEVCKTKGIEVDFDDIDPAPGANRISQPFVSRVQREQEDGELKRGMERLEF
ncbi:hypothetical protein JCM8097_004049 [Rhodosporidiobolus ruineniae]